MTDELNEFSVVSFTLSEDKRVMRIREEGQGHFLLDIIKAEVEEMIRSLQAMCEMMVD